MCDKAALLDELFKEACTAYCTQCTNYRTETLGIHTVGGCACGIEPTKCILNPLIKTLRKQKEARNVQND